MSGTVIDFAPDQYLEKVAASASERWPGSVVKRVRHIWRTRNGRLIVYRTYAAFLGGGLVWTARVNRAGVVLWFTPRPTEKWEVE